MIQAAILDKFIGLLLPLFLPSAGGDMIAARQAASHMLFAYDAGTEDELSLAAEIICFTFAALEALSNAMNPELTINAVLRLRGSANALHRSAHRCHRLLDKRRKERAKAQTNEPLTNELPQVDANPPTPETLHLSDYAQPAPQPDPRIALSRQQRRALQRKLDKIHRKQAENARREVLHAARTQQIVTAIAPADPQQVEEAIAA
jgi:hypothetical protein